MTGTLNVVASGAAGVSDFRIVQVQFNVAGAKDLVELENLGAAGDLQKYRLKVSGVAVQTLLAATGVSYPVAAGGHVIIHINASGTNTATDIFLPGVTDLPATGSVALYVPNQVNTALTDATQIIDYVEWGASGQENEATANTAGVWGAGTAMTNVADGHSIAFCGQPGQYGISHWAELASPTFPSNGTCATPTLRTTWGRIKTLYH